MIREHQYDEGTDRCVHCGDKRGDTSAGGGGIRSCIAREAPRAPFESFDAKPWEIGEAMKRIREEEDKALAGAGEAPMEGLFLEEVRPSIREFYAELARALRDGVPVPALEIKRMLGE